MNCESCKQPLTEDRSKVSSFCTRCAMEQMSRKWKKIMNEAARPDPHMNRKDREQRRKR